MDTINCIINMHLMQDLVIYDQLEWTEKTTHFDHREVGVGSVVLVQFLRRMPMLHELETTEIRLMHLSPQLSKPVPPHYAIFNNIVSTKGSYRGFPT